MNEINHGERKEKMLNFFKKLFLKFRRMLGGKQKAKSEVAGRVSAVDGVRQAQSLPRIGPEEASLEHMFDEQEAQMDVDRRYGKAIQSAEEDNDFS